MKTLTKEAQQLLNQYDFYTSYIDSNRQRKEALDRNNNILKALEMNGFTIDFDDKSIKEIKPKHEIEYTAFGFTYNSLEEAQKAFDTHKKYLKERVNNTNDSFTQADMNSILNRNKIEKINTIYNKETCTFNQIKEQI